MNSDKLWLKSEIEKFLSVIKDCIENTTYAEDKNIYKRDLLFVGKWLEELEKDSFSHLDIINEILDNQTAKILTDYWRNGEWGEKHNKAFINLISKVKS